MPFIDEVMSATQRVNDEGDVVFDRADTNAETLDESGFRDEIGRIIEGDLLDSEAKVEHMDTSDDDCREGENEIPLNPDESSRSVSKELSLPYGFYVGDMVWGKVKSHPWWPGHIFNESFASPSVRRAKRDGHVLVAFYGDSSYGWFDLEELIPFDAHFAEKCRQTNSKAFAKAVEEAVDEASRRSSLGLICECRDTHKSRPLKIEGYVAVDVPGYEAGGIYSWVQLRKAKERFETSKLLSFVNSLAVSSETREDWSIEWFKNRAAVFAYRKAVYEEFDETYAQAFGMQASSRSSDSKPDKDNQSSKGPSRAPLSGRLVVAETLGNKKGSVRGGRVKDHSKHVVLNRQADDSEEMSSSEKTDEPSIEGFVFKRRVQAEACVDEPLPQEHEAAAVTADESNEKTEDVVGDGMKLSEVLKLQSMDKAAEKKRRRKKKTAGGSKGKQQNPSVSSSPVAKEEDSSSISFNGVELRHLSSNLQRLAVDHFLDPEETRITRLCFLRFRSVVYQKSLSASRPTETDASTEQPEPPVQPVPVIVPEPEPVPVRQQRPQMRPDDPTRGGQKRPMSERQEEINVKRAKRLSELKSIALEKKAKRPSSAPPLPTVAAAGPVMLQMKFPPLTSLPSAAEMKARFARFGALDQSGTRVYWRTSTCRITFLRGADAQAAYRYAVGNPSLFGTANVRYRLCEVGSEPAADGPANGNLPPGMRTHHPPPHHPAPPVQLKSCLKKPSAAEEASPAAAGEAAAAAAETVAFVHSENDQFTMQCNLALPEIVGTSASASDVDISQRMLSLLARCSDLVTHVKASLGHVPYRSL